MEDKIIYRNSLDNEDAIKDWISEGAIKISFDEGMILENGLSEDLGDHAHWTFWLPNKFPENIKIEWKFRPLREPGLCMLFFAADTRNGESIFDPKLKKRTGYYPQYHHGDINAYHLSYFRHKYEEERAFRTCNLRKSYGFHMVAQGADPLPPTEDAIGFYDLKVEKREKNISFYIDDLLLLEWTDTEEHGPALKEGHIGFRQMAPLKAEYKDLVITELR